MIAVPADSHREGGDQIRIEWVEGRSAMSALISSVKHARYAMGSLTAVLFAATVGASF